jgi:hypothetical protein
MQLFNFYTLLNAVKCLLMCTRQSDVSALNAAGLLLDSNSNDALSGRGCIAFGERDIRLYIDEQLGRKEGSYELKAAAKSPRLLSLVMKQQRGRVY